MTHITETDRELAHVVRVAPVLKLLFTAGQTQTRQWGIGSQPILIGHEVDVDAGVALKTDQKVSALHARIHASSTEAHIEDAGSKNGTFVNGHRIHVGKLASGDIIRVGNSLMLFRVISTAPSDASADAQVAHDLFVGSSPAVQHLRSTLVRAAPQDTAVLLQGATGTGKELAAQVIHSLSGRSGPLVRVNSSAINASLAESMLFGHAESAFTNAKKHTGYFREADGGTLVLDEIGELSPELQPKLLRALEERVIWPVGARRAEPCNVRIIASTNRDLKEEVQRGRFRSDLYARLAAIPIVLPALSERQEDILPLFLKKLQFPNQTLTARLCEALLLYPWPQNVRELLNLADYARTFAPATGPLDLPLLAERLMPPSSLSSEKDPDPQSASRLLETPESQQRRRAIYDADVLTRLMQENRGVLARVAEQLGLSRRQLGRALEKFGIDPNDFRRDDT